MSTFNVCPLFWHLCSKSNTEKSERIHFRVLTFIFQDIEALHDDLISRAGTTTLHLSRVRGLAIEFFKIINGKCPVYLQHFMTLKKSSLARHSQSYKYKVWNIFRF